MAERRAGTSRLRVDLQGVRGDLCPELGWTYGVAADRYSLGRLIYDVGISLAKACEPFGRSRSPPPVLNLTIIGPALTNQYHPPVAVPPSCPLSALSLILRATK